MSDPRKGNAYAVKAPPAPPEERWQYRLVESDPWGEPSPPRVGSLAEVLEWHADAEEAGLDAVIEYKVPGVTWTPWRRPLLLSELAEEGLASEQTRMVRRGPGDMREETRWELGPGAWERLREAERS